jgi:DNA polymerase III epsilon subunit-like protein
MTASGDVVDEFVSLLNPERDIGPTSIHGLESSDIAEAPTFSELAGELSERFDGTTSEVRSLPVLNSIAINYVWEKTTWVTK